MESKTNLDALAAELRLRFLNHPFGIVQFWGWAQVPANDQSYLLVSTHVDGDRLDLIFVHESHTGLPGVLSVWSPEGLEEAPADLLPHAPEGCVAAAPWGARMTDFLAHLKDPAYQARNRWECVAEDIGETEEE